MGHVEVTFKKGDTVYMLPSARDISVLENNIGRPCTVVDTGYNAGGSWGIGYLVQVVGDVGHLKWFCRPQDLSPVPISSEDYVKAIIANPEGWEV